MYVAYLLLIILKILALLAISLEFFNGQRFFSQRLVLEEYMPELFFLHPRAEILIQYYNRQGLSFKL